MSEERIFTMSAFEAAHLIRSFREKNGNLTTVELIQITRAIRADFYSHDYDTGADLEGMIGKGQCSLPAEEFFTSAVNSIIEKSQPFWARLAPAGRSHVLQAIGVDGSQCLRAAGLLDTSNKTTEWWDNLAMSHRGERDARLLAQGREGERLSLDFERARLSREGISREPAWIAIEDNTVGYDIHSYAFAGEKETNRLIEVKTTRSDKPRMILSRNEWETADSFGASYEFHLWEFPSQKLSIFTVDEIRAHIPYDNGRGEWESVEIRPL